MTKRFLDFLESRRAMAKIDRVVVDECHTILEGTPSFRPKLRELGQLALFGLQMVYLTATLPPSLEHDFFRTVNAREEDVVMIRARTTRGNVAYSVTSVAATTAREATAAIVSHAKHVIDRKLEEYPWPAKVIVYCQRVEATEDLAEKLGCDAYHREVDTRDGKAERLRLWMSGTRRGQYGEGRVIVATNALGLGIDVPDIRAVVHIEMPRTMADYAQQSGRAGRDGQRSEAIVIRLDAQGSSRRQRPLIAGEAALEDYISGGVCRRVVLDSVMDGRSDRVACEDGEELCDVCQRGAVEDDLEDGPGRSEDEEDADLRERELKVHTARHRATSLAVGEQEGFREYRRKLMDQRLIGCVFCSLLRASDDDRAHSALRCQMAGNYAIAGKTTVRRVDGGELQVEGVSIMA
ncbi:hypothetical protein CDV36_016209 [Fusarium kuroshium]|uniref:DNA 3'-5' helicase n=1 Tax=Fusarium kuroshium TaxID=2010991 RepID=A0A3M2QWX8_9HYPO|nr:hypothetical protein CDV36_016209 [Fusarium kuroshium]